MTFFGCEKGKEEEEKWAIQQNKKPERYREGSPRLNNGKSQSLPPLGLRFEHRAHDQTCNKLKGLCVRTQLYLLATGRTCKTRQILTQLERIHTQHSRFVKMVVFVIKPGSHKSISISKRLQPIMPSMSSLNITLTDICKKRRLMSMFLSKTSSLKIKLLMFIVMLASR